MALTLLEAAKVMSGDVKRQAIIDIYASTTDILRVLPFETIAGNALRYNQEQTLPGIGFRGVNASYTASTGILNPVTEPLVIAGGELDVDRFIVATMGMDQRSTQEAMKVKSLAHTWGDAFIKGDSGSGSGQFDGLKQRLPIACTQSVSGGSTDGGDACSLAKLDQLIDKVVEPSHLVMNLAMRRRLTVAARTTSVGGQIDYTVDQFGRKITMYNGLEILIADRNSDANATLAFNEVGAGGTTATATSIYCLSLREGMLVGLQNSPPMVTDLGELQTQPVYRTRVEWYAGIALFHPKAAARYYGISDAAVVA